jgi:dinuclear metal center YbgI/SA1388 family protein
MIKANDIIQKIEELAPLTLSEQWDNSGLQIGSREKQVKNLMVSLDITPEIIEEAINSRIDMILTHHPLIFNPINKITSDNVTGRILLKLISNDISVYSSHTCLDIAPNGLNDLFASLIGLRQTTILEEVEKDIKHVKNVDGGVGMGRIGVLEKETTLENLMNLIKKELNITDLRYTGSKKDVVKSVAICTGSGGSLIPACIEKKADVFITGDLKYHEALTAMFNGLNLIDAGHYETEIIMVRYITDYIKESFGALNVIMANENHPIFFNY